MDKPLLSDEVYAFGSFELDVVRRQLSNGTTVIPVKPRAFEILTLLIQRAGTVVEKRELMNAVWPGLSVDDANLRVHIAALRRLLQKHPDEQPYIVNEAGRGYRFVVPVRRHGGNPPADSNPQGQEKKSRLPVRLTRVIGRCDLVERLTADLAYNRCLSIVGPGGIGKTTVALSLANQICSNYADGVTFVDLAPLRQADLLPNTVALAIGIPVRSEDETESLLAFLGDQRSLLILDNCEHVIDVVAPLIERICRAAPCLHIVATSREDLAIEGERIHRLVPLASPPASEEGLEAISLYPAVQLFVERATSHVDTFRLTPDNAPQIADICRRLDGLPLALELAAGSLDTFGIEGLARGLDDRFQLLTRGRRTALPRQKTLRLTLDWSHDLLTAEERKALRRLGCFTGSFTFAAAQGTVCDASLTPATLVSAIANLVSKSLVTAETDQKIIRYRLLDTTRAYALEHLAASGETIALAARHANWYRRMLDEAREQAMDRSLSYLALDLDNVRLALNWAFSPGGDRDIAIGLTLAAAALFIDLGLLVECLSWTRRALACLRPTDRGTRTEMELNINYAMPFLFTQGSTPELEAILERAHDLAHTLSDHSSQARILDGLHMYHLRAGNFRDLFRISARAEDLSPHLENTLSSHVWMGGIAHHIAGNHNEATLLLGKALDSLPVARPISPLRVGVDHRVHAGMSYIRSLMMQGHGTKASALATQLLHEAQETGSVITNMIALMWTLPLAILLGDIPTARVRLKSLEDISRNGLLLPASLAAMGYRAILDILDGDTDNGIPLLRQSIEGVRRANYFLLDVTLMTFLVEAYLQAEKPLEASAVALEALALAEMRGDTVNTPQLLISQAKAMEMRGAESSQITAALHSAIYWAQHQGALPAGREAERMLALIDAKAA